MNNLHRSIFSSNGSAVELNNCLEEARIATAHGNSAEGAAIDRALALGLFVVIERAPAYCRSTDAVCGEHRALRSTHVNRQDAEAACQTFYVAHGSYSDSSFGVYPLPPAEFTPETPNDEENLPF